MNKPFALGGVDQGVVKGAKAKLTECRLQDANQIVSSIT